MVVGVGTLFAASTGKEREGAVKQLDALKFLETSKGDAMKKAEDVLEKWFLLLQKVGVSGTEALQLNARFFAQWALLRQWTHKDEQRLRVFSDGLWMWSNNKIKIIIQKKIIYFRQNIISIYKIMWTFSMIDRSGHRPFP